MPVKIERELKAQAHKRGLTGKRFDAYVFGTLSRIKKKRKKK